MGDDVQVYMGGGMTYSLGVHRWGGDEKVCKLVNLAMPKIIE